MNKFFCLLLATMIFGNNCIFVVFNGYWYHIMMNKYHIGLDHGNLFLEGKLKLNKNYSLTIEKDITFMFLT